MSNEFRPPWERDLEEVRKASTEAPPTEVLPPLPPVNIMDEEDEPAKPPLRLIPGRKPNTGKNKHGRKLMKRTEENLTPKMKERRDRFISEFVKDYNGPLAYIRAGGNSSTAAKMASEFLREPYVTRRIWEIVDSLEEAEIINRKHILAGLVREAQYQGIGASHGARVTAWHHLAKILGMEQTNVNLKGDIRFKGGVMLVPAPDPMTWEQAAAEAQKQLKEDVRK